MPDAANSGDLFVFYGLLKQGAAGAPAALDLAGAGTFGTPCRFRGRMVDLGGFPGVVAGETVCHGLLWRLRDADIVPEIDAFEDVTDDASTSLYLRVKVALLNDAGAATGEDAWIYWYNRSVDGYAPVADGNWPLDAGKTRK
ncbi:MAG: gamma-glutamylcyclotransferase family protein [Hyphomonas sp.]|uniref:gamma-glutamylcyclotransferase n=1 Tax=Hyphomonas sp. TaxID=87 RepID=UPI0034A02519